MRRAAEKRSRIEDMRRGEDEATETDRGEGGKTTRTETRLTYMRRREDSDKNIEGKIRTDEGLA